MPGLRSKMCAFSDSLTSTTFDPLRADTNHFRTTSHRHEPDTNPHFVEFVGLAVTLYIHIGKRSWACVGWLAEFFSRSQAPPKYTQRYYAIFCKNPNSTISCLFHVANQNYFRLSSTNQEGHKVPQKYTELLYVNFFRN